MINPYFFLSSNPFQNSELFDNCPFFISHSPLKVFLHSNFSDCFFFFPLKIHHPLSQNLMQYLYPFPQRKILFSQKKVSPSINRKFYNGKNVLQLNTENFHNVHFNTLDNDFFFVVNHKIYPTNKIIADILSPKITLLHQTDKLLSTYEFQTQKQGDFSKLIEYVTNQKISLSDDEVNYFLEVFQTLGNSLEFENICPEINEKIRLDNVFSKLKTKASLSLDCKNEIDFIAAHFEELYNKHHNDLIGLDESLIECIFKNSKFQIPDENFLFKVILELSEKSKNNLFLFENVSFSNISIDLLNDFIQKFDIDYLTINLWKQIGQCLQKKESDEIQILSKKIDIFEYLSKQCGGISHLKKHVIITSSSNNPNPENIFDKDVTKYYITKDEKNSWIQFDFLTKKVLISTYSLQTQDCGEGNVHLKSWILEGSDDGSTFETIDQEDNCNKLNGPLCEASFGTNQKNPYRYIRLTQTGKNWYNDDRLLIQRIRFYGLLQ